VSTAGASLDKVLGGMVGEGASLKQLKSSSSRWKEAKEGSSTSSFLPLTYLADLSVCVDRTAGIELYLWES